MSIAVSAIVRPSRWLNAAFCAMLAAIAVVAVAIVLGGLGDFSPLGKTMIAATSVISIVFALLHGASRKSAYLIDITPAGDIRLRTGPLDVLQADVSRPAVARDSQPVRLMPGSTIWPVMMSLQLQSLATGKSHWICILPDSMSRCEFRALLVACRWIADRKAGSAAEMPE